MRTIYSVLGVKAGPAGQTMAELIEARNIARATYRALTDHQRKRVTTEQLDYDDAVRILRSACIRQGVAYPD